MAHKRTGQIWHKSAWQRENIPAWLAELGIEEPYDPATDPRNEREMEQLTGVCRIMDDGKVRWKWTRPDTDRKKQINCAVRNDKITCG